MCKKNIDMHELKKIELDILKSISSFCERHNLKYYLAYGTLIGAIRHEGFIPWDDDIDIWMKREDYDRFFYEFNLENSKMKAICVENEPNYYLAYGKVIDTTTVMEEMGNNNIPIGVYVDVFPLDNIPDSKLKFKIQNIQLGFFRSLLVLKSIVPNTNRGIWKNIILVVSEFILRPIKRKTLIHAIDYLSRMHNGKPTDKVGTLVSWTYGAKEMFNTNMFNGGISKMFENSAFTCPEGYDCILKNLYGDYMKLPPVEKQVSHHDFIAYMK